MHVGICSDHGGFELKNKLTEILREAEYQITDFGAFSLDPQDDYPDFVIPLANAVAEGKVARGVAVCGSGVGVSVAANKFKGIRAGLCHDHYSAHQGVEHDNMNILVMGSRIIGPMLAQDVTQAFLNATFSGEERHVRRLNKVKGIEENELC